MKTDSGENKHAQMKVNTQKQSQYLSRWRLEVKETHPQINKHARQLQSHRYFITSMNAQKHKHDTRQDEGWLCRGEISHTDKSTSTKDNFAISNTNTTVGENCP